MFKNWNEIIASDRVAFPSLISWNPKLNYPNLLSTKAKNGTILQQNNLGLLSIVPSSQSDYLPLPSVQP